VTYLRINGVDLYSEVVGNGDAVLLLHGGFCSLENLREQGDALARDHRVYAFERPGHGRSADIGGPFSYARGVSDTIAYLDRMELSAVHVVGYSDGAIIGLLLALDHPDRVRSLISMSGNLDPSAFAHSDEAAGVPVLPQPPETDHPDLERMHYERLSPDGPEHGDVVLGKLLELWASEPHISSADLARVAAPTLVISGDRDMIRPDHSTLIAASIPHAQLCIVPNASHDLIAERPELLKVFIGDFLRHVEAREAQLPRA
jgi:pimeloyl-ACP methyl ester carboxylesterase